MKLDPPKIMLEHSFLRALAVPSEEHHAAAVAIYLPLVAQYEAEQVLLVAVSDHLRDFRDWRRHGPLAPVDELYVGHQHRRAAARMDPDDFHRSLTLVMCERHNVHRMATVDPTFAQYDLRIEAAPAMPAIPDAPDAPAAPDAPDAPAAADAPSTIAANGEAD